MSPPIAVSLLILISNPFAALSASEPDRIFPADAVVNVTLPPYGAKPDDDSDDTAAIQRAISANVGTGRVLYFPAGVYNVCDSLVAKNIRGNWEAHLTLQGQRRDKTILRLASGAPGFGDAAHPKGVLVTGSHWEPGDASDGGGNKAFRNNVFDLTIDTGSGNAGAIGIDYAVSNQGAIERVTITGGGVAGIALRRKIPGPGLIRDVAVRGFDTGIDLGDIQYGLTLEHVTVEGQRVAGIRTSRNVLHMRGITSRNRVPALVVSDRLGMATLLDSDLSGGDAGEFAIDCAGSLLVRHVKIGGYRARPIRCRDGEREPGPIISPPAIGENAFAPLEIRETPAYWNGDLSDWSAVGARREGEPDDTAAIQRAIDAGKSVVYFPNDRTYFLSDTIIVRGAVRQVLGMGAEISLGAAEPPFRDPQNPRPLLRIDSPAGAAVFLENLFFNAQYPGELLILNNSPAMLVISHSSGWVGASGIARTYRNTPKATGPLFIEDVFLPGWEFTGQHVWARQFNPENWASDGSEPQVTNTDGVLWILGFKTEGAAPFLATRSGGRTELLGGYNYISATKSATVPADSIPYLADNATMALTFLAENFRDSDYRAYIRQTLDGKTTVFARTELPPRSGHPGDRSIAVTLFQGGK
ncbi:pectate lyase superfamily protein [Terrimicrobium sacchariphilum]|uniref:Pectate lyase superfamily protein n=1 Tax=Terrimicrobium sacchariphilum TaxID=690879 RepID=A0A146GA62_TERSA|nr:glycoside hydrolase family 55 protein [Terrimicrobium sacchariphilum]GAT34535.1 pectate lyase superfamily protein [Terrimicrobium sacchariphilum]